VVEAELDELPLAEVRRISEETCNEIREAELAA
jgi:hypothetical protein